LVGCIRDARTRVVGVYELLVRKRRNAHFKKAPLCIPSSATSTVAPAHERRFSLSTLSTQSGRICDIGLP